MNDAELKGLWRQQEIVPPLKVSDTELVERMKKKMRKFDRTLFWRDGRELTACVIVFGAFFYFSLRHPSTLSLVGCVVIMLSSLFIAWKLIAARRAHPPVSETASTSDFVRAELGKVTRQTHLLQTVLWWYLLPLFIGLELFELGHPETLAGELFSLVFNLAIFGGVYWLNLYAVRKSLMPLKQKLENILNSVSETDSDQNPNH
jgi:hypothetical protein